MRRPRLSARLLTAAVVALAVAAVSVSGALADTNTGTSDSGLTVTAALSPDTVSGHQQVTQTATVENDGRSTVTVSMRVFSPKRPSTAPPQAVFVTLAPGGSFSESAGYPASDLSPGTHTLVAVAINRATRDSALASASITVN